MLKRFEVENFKGFNEPIVFDLTAREYAFNKGIVKNNIVNKAIVYGKNGVGKSCLGYALFDAVWHLTDKERLPVKYLYNYLNLLSSKDYAIFKFYFQFDDDEVIYEYGKKDPENLIYERISVNNDLFLNYDYFDKSRNILPTYLIGDLKIELVDNKLSVVKYIYRNTPTNVNSPITKMMIFFDNMLWYRSLSDGNAYCGFSNGVYALVEKLYECGKIREFEDFLHKNDLDYKLEFRSNNGIHELLADFDGKKAPFVQIASTGTMALFLFFTWSISFEKLSFLFIDEFDAFFHFESAETIIQILNKNRSFQTVLTSHNTYLMQNKLTRPDCCFIMTNQKICSLVNSTDKEIREAHNLEKMYVNGAFNE